MFIGHYDISVVAFNHDVPSQFFILFSKNKQKSNQEKYFYDESLRNLF